MKRRLSSSIYTRTSLKRSIGAVSQTPVYTKRWTRGQTDPLTSTQSCKHSHPHTQSASHNSQSAIIWNSFGAETGKVTFTSELKLASLFRSSVAKGRLVVFSSSAVSKPSRLAALASSDERGDQGGRLKRPVNALQWLVSVNSDELQREAESPE